MPRRAGALQVLGERLRSFGPPSLSTLIARLGQLEDYQDFVSLVREFLPEREANIVGQTTPQRQMAAFASYFEDRYFPLANFLQNEDAEEYEDVTRGIPIMVRGMSYDDYDYIASDMRPGLQLMTYLVESPWQDNRGRVALAEACLNGVPIELLRRVPGDGLSPRDAHRFFDDTAHAAVATWADILHWSTGNYLLDTDDETFCSSGPPDWSRENVEALVSEHQQADRLYQECVALAEWLEGDPEPRFAEILDCIEPKGETDNDPDARAGWLPVGSPGRP